ncbi:hypothetical protein GQ53DRAFT_861677 [Thozetella sp. PMI_491]|nr:hypothetical protein GQ53DRAFT_861677 [Thozetella sp. PMI_491]
MAVVAFPVLALFVTWSVLPLALASSQKSSVADTVFLNGSIYTLDNLSRKVSALTITNGVITSIGNDKDIETSIGPSTAVINLRGRMAMPGLVDAHMHTFSGGQFLLKCNLNYQPLNLSAVLSHIQGCINAESGKEATGEWLEVVNMDWPTLSTASGPITKSQLDSLKTVRPVFVRSSDYHTVWANSKALAESNITAATADPPNGKVERLANGEPSGILEDDARSLLAGPAPASDQDNINSCNAALKLLRESGITSWQEAAASPTIGTAYEAIKKAGRLSARGWFDYMIDSPNSTNAVPAAIRDVRSVLSAHNDPSPLSPNPTLKWQAIKGFLDGVITYPASTGAVVEPYYQPVVESALLNGIDAQFHADGDLAVRVALDSVQNFRVRHPGKTDYRVGIAHDELTTPEDWPRFAELGVDAIMSFQWAQPSSFWVPDTFKALGPNRQNYLEAWGDIAKRGRNITYGSDWPIDPLDVWLALKAGVTRSGDPQNPNSPASQGPQYGGVLLPGPSLTREAALRSYTIEAAKFLRADAHIGTLEVGKLADMIVLESDFFRLPDDELGRQRVLLTMVGGQVLYVADGQDFGVKPKFPNNETTTHFLEALSVGGFGGKHLSEQAKKSVARLHRRGSCDHGQSAPKHRH